MKYHLSLLFVAASLAGALAAPPKDYVSADAKWLLHVDLVELRTTKVGGFFLDFLERQLEFPLTQIKEQANIGIDSHKLVSQLNTITLYGTDYQKPERTSVAVVRTQPELEKMVVGALAGMVLAETNDPPRIQEKRQGDVTFYLIRDERKNKDVVIAILPNRAVVFGSSRELVEQGVQVVNRKAPNLASTKTFSNFAEVKNTFFFLAVGEGFSNSGLPPQARLLKLADGGRLVIGENADRVFLDLALEAKTSEIVTQMQQVVQGLIAFGSLGQPENKDLAHVLQSIKVSTDKNIVNVTLDYPAADLVEELNKAKGAKRKAKKPAEELEQ